MSHSACVKLIIKDRLFNYVNYLALALFKNEKLNSKIIFIIIMY